MDEIAGLLRQAVFGTPGDAAERARALDAAPGLAQAAAFHGVTGYVAQVMQGNESPGLARERAELNARRNQVALRHLRVVHDLYWLETVLGAADVPWLVLKGPVLAQQAHRDPALRAYSDVDLLVPRSRLGATLVALEANGSRVIDRNWELVHRSMKGEVHVQLPSGTVLDLHWHLINSARLRQHFRIEPNELFDRARLVQVGPLQVPTLSPEDTLAYVALHAMLSGGHRLVWLKDVERLVAIDDAQPAAVVGTARDWGAYLAVLTALLRVDLAARTHTVDRFASAASPTERGWMSVCSSVWRRWPLEAEDGSGSPARLLSRSARPTVAASLREMTRRSWAFTRSRGGDTLPHERTIMDAEHPQSILFPSGGERGRRVYLDAVAMWTPAGAVGRRRG